jgi:hypothetical protein
MPELDGQDPFQIRGLLCQTIKTPTLGGAVLSRLARAKVRVFVV